MSILHLISASSPLCGPPLLYAVRELGQDMAILGVPDSATAEFTRDLPVNMTCKATGRAAARALRHHFESGSSCEVLLCWDDEAYEAARSCRHSNICVVRVPEPFQTVPPARSILATADRVASRDSLGIDQDRLVLLPIGSGESIDAFQIVRIAGILAYAGEPITLLLPQRAHQIERARRFLALHQDDWQTILIPRTTMDHFYAATATFIWPPSMPTRHDSLARLESDAMLAESLGRHTVGSSETAARFKPLAIDGVSTEATMPEIARAVRSALHAPSPRHHGALPVFADWASNLEQLTGERAAVQGC